MSLINLSRKLLLNLNSWGNEPLAGDCFGILIDENVVQLFSEPVVGLDPKYFEHSTPGGTLTRLQIPDVNNLPSNVRRPVGGGLLRRNLDSVPDL